MTTYVTLYNFTDQGIKNIKRTETATKAAAEMGMHVKDRMASSPSYCRTHRKSIAGGSCRF